MFMIESVDEIRNFYQLTSATQSSYPLRQSPIFGLTHNQMEILIPFIIGLLIAIVVVPFVALAKANSGKRSIDDLATRLSSLEKEVRSLGRDTVPTPKSEAPVGTMEAVPPPGSITTAPPILQAKESVPPPIPQRFLDPTIPPIARTARPPIDC